MEENSSLPIETPPALVEWKRIVNDAYLLLADIREDAAWQMGVNEWLQDALSLAERVKATPVDEPPSSPSRERVEVLEAALRECGADWKSPPCTLAEAPALLWAEFIRRAELARAAVEDGTND